MSIIPPWMPQNISKRVLAGLAGQDQRKGLPPQPAPIRGRQPGPPGLRIHIRGPSTSPESHVHAAGTYRAVGRIPSWTFGREICRLPERDLLCYIRALSKARLLD